MTDDDDIHEVVVGVALTRATNGWLAEISTVDEEDPRPHTHMCVFTTPGEMLDHLAKLLIKNGNVIDFHKVMKGGDNDEKTKR